jgi:threonine/homoserine/homoserine lactone efflux protein
MVSVGTLTVFSLIALAVAVIPGPNMVYVLSQSLSFGSSAGVLALAAVTIGLVTHMLAAAFGITALVIGVPHALSVLRVVGAVTLTYLALKALVAAPRAFDARGMSHCGVRKVFGLGIVVSLLNPAIALLYLTLLPQFINPARGSVLVQALVLGTTHIFIETFVNSAVVIAAKVLSRFANRPKLALPRRLLTCFVLVALAARTALTSVPLPSDAIAAPGRVERAGAYEQPPISGPTDRRIIDVHEFADSRRDTRSIGDFRGDRAMERPGVSVDGPQAPQAGAKTLPLLARKFGKPGSLTIPDGALEPTRSFGSLVDMRVKWQDREEWKAIELVSSHSKPTLVAHFAKKKYSLRTVEKRNGFQPVTRRSGAL